MGTSGAGPALLVPTAAQMYVLESASSVAVPGSSPIAYARSNGEPWATWWGDKDVILHDPLTEARPAPDALSRLPEEASSGKP